MIYYIYNTNTVVDNRFKKCRELLCKNVANTLKSCQLVATE